MTKDERIKQLEIAVMQLFDMVHESENIQNKIKANDLYDTIIGQSLPIDSVSVREFECDDVVCTNDGKMWVITEIDGDDVYVTGNGKKDYPLEKSDITHAH